MAFHYRRAPFTQHIFLSGMLLMMVGMGATDVFAQVWRAWVTQVPERVQLTGGFMLLHTLLFWPLALGFHYVDRTNRPHFIAKHRIQSGKRRAPPMKRVIWVLLRNQFLLLPALLFIFGEVILTMGWRPNPELPSLATLGWEVGGQAVLSVAYFYAAHRFLHRKWWLKRVHRVHHEFRTSSAFASEYAHPAEFVLGNFGALSIGALILLPSLASMYVFATISLFTFVVHHSGYALPWAPWSVPHDWHHYRYHEMFGTTGLLDRLLGTAPEYFELKEGDMR